MNEANMGMPTGDYEEVSLEDQYEIDRKKADQVKPIVAAFLSGGKEEQAKAVEYLRNNPKNVFEFAMQVKDSYSESDKYTAVVRLAEVIEALL